MWIRQIKHSELLASLSHRAPESWGCAKETGGLNLTNLSQISHWYLKGQRGGLASYKHCCALSVSQICSCVRMGKQGMEAGGKDS